MNKYLLVFSVALISIWLVLNATFFFVYYSIGYFQTNQSTNVAVAETQGKIFSAMTAAAKECKSIKLESTEGKYEFVSVNCLKKAGE